VTHVPTDDGIYLDHLAHWVPDLDAAGAALEQIGFRLTPRTDHVHAPAPSAALEPAGTANRCIMLREGYLEILSATADTPVGAEVRAALARHTGVHLAAFCVRDPLAEHDRLVAAGFGQRPPVALTRAATLEEGTAVTLAFRVVRPQPGLLPEGRVQFLSHETPQWLWETRWLAQPNGAEALTDLLFVSDDVDECTGRYARYLRTAPERTGGGAALFRLARGTLTVLPAARAAEALAGVEPAPAPCMAGYALRVADLDATGAFLHDAGHRPRRAANGACVLAMPAALGGIVAFHAGQGAPWAREP
jgi:hypothetical protein